MPCDKWWDRSLQKYTGMGLQKMWAPWHMPIRRMCGKTSRVPEGKEPSSQVVKDSGVEQSYVWIMMLWACPKSEKAPN